MPKTIIEEIYEDLKFNRKKFVLAAFTILLFVTGYIIAPEPIPDGSYTINLQYSGSEQLDITFSFILNSSIDFPQNEQLIKTYKGEFQLVIRSWEAYPGKIGEVIHFEAIMFRNNISLIDLDDDNFSGTLRSIGDEIDFSPSSIEGDRVIFDIRILKNSDVGLGLLFAISFLWLTELIPLAASSLIIPVVIVISGIDGPTGAFANFANPIIFLFLSGFLMAEAMDRSELDKYISLRIVSFVPPKPGVLMFTFMVLSAVFSMFMSNTAAVAILIPIAMTMLKSAEIEDPAYKRAMVLGIAYAATVGGIGTMIGTAPNIIAVQFIKEYNPAFDINFLEWLVFGLPVVAIMIPVVFFYLWFRYRPTLDAELLKKAQSEGLSEIKRQEHLTWEQIIVSLIFVFIIGMWLTTQFHGISASVVAVMGAILFFFTGQIKKEDLQEISWPTLITFGGGLSLGYVIIETGLADFIASKLSLMGSLSFVLTTTIIALIALILTAFASNTAAAAILIPIVIPLAIVLGINPILMAILVAITCSLDFAMVIGTPPTMLAYATGLFKVKDIFNIGIILDAIGLIVVLVLSWTLFGVLANIV